MRLAQARVLKSINQLACQPAKKPLFIVSAGLAPKPRPLRRLVRTFFQDHVQSAPGARVEMKVLTRDIRALASIRGVVLPGINELLDDIAAICEERAIAIEVGDDQRVHCLGVRVSTAAGPALH